MRLFKAEVESKAKLWNTRADTVGLIKSIFVRLHIHVYLVAYKRRMYLTIFLLKKPGDFQGITADG